MTIQSATHCSPLSFSYFAYIRASPLAPLQTATGATDFEALLGGTDFGMGGGGFPAMPPIPNFKLDKISQTT
jgi:hypothetical protein